MSTTFNTFDLIFFAFTAIFVIMATFRGFVKEIFALFNWIIALLISYLATPYIADFMSKHFENRLAVDLVTRTVVFSAIFIGSIYATANLRDSLHDRMPRLFDRSLGLLFGFLKTLIIFGAIYSIYFNVSALVMGKIFKEKKKEPIWFEQAKSRSLIKTAGNIIDPAISKIFEAISGNIENALPKSEDELKDKIDEITKDKNLDLDNARDLTDDELKNLDTGYSKKNIEKMNQLMDVINK